MVKVSYKAQPPLPTVEVGDFRAQRKDGTWLWQQRDGNWYHVGQDAATKLLDNIVKENSAPSSPCGCGASGGCKNCPPNSCPCK